MKLLVSKCIKEIMTQNTNTSINLLTNTISLDKEIDTHLVHLG